MQISDTPKRLTRARIFGPTFSHDGRRIAFSSGMNGSFDIWVMGPGSPGRLRRLTQSIHNDFNPVFSPDSTQIAFVRSHWYSEEECNIHLIKVDGDGEKQLTESRRDHHPVFSPDGLRLVFESFRSRTSSEIYAMNADGTQQEPLTQTWMTGSGFRGPGSRNAGAVFSPDGRKIAFASSRPDQHEKLLQYEVYTMNPDGTEQMRLTHTPLGVRDVTFSPDGSRIAYRSSGGKGEAMYVYVMDSDGTHQTRMENSRDVDAVGNFSPDGTHLLFTSRRDNRTARMQDMELYVLHLDSGNARRLTQNDACDRDPVFSPDGKQIVFVSDLGGADALCHLEADTGC